MSHQEPSSASVELIVPLYDGWIRFLYRAVNAVDSADAVERRHAVKRALEYLTYLQASLRADVGGASERALADFYDAMFTIMLEASHTGSREDLLGVIACVRNVRAAWVAAACAPRNHRDPSRDLRRAAERRPGYSVSAMPINMGDTTAASRWSA